MKLSMFSEKPTVPVIIMLSDQSFPKIASLCLANVRFSLYIKLFRKAHLYH